MDSRSETSCNFVGLITVKVTTDSEFHAVSGAMIAENTPRIVKIDDYNTSISPAEHILITPHQDKPGMIAKVATILGNNSVNISMMQVARKDAVIGGESIMIINADNPVNPDLLEQIKQIDGVFDAKYINLNPDKTLSQEKVLI